MKISYQAENIVRDYDISNFNIDDIEELMLVEYQEALGDNSIRFVDDVPQYFNTTVEVKESSSYLMEGMPSREVETGNHINAITRGDPSISDESNVL
ncbi:hypothetical protein MM221_07100 [Salipaludibacillus sp. LMS25]|uniref:hypothetical protein n=1 Tax=Salipaludibacillus sp. LMS25 TaxID=2924031 RepID=UPI0020D14971|nr:hypothetical protein [Salipaludibacillus sp. LMS25]UTR16308.1 hypothetical protein MM221_07100 [Salipaludibacillus sp. LMS25]